MVCSIQIGCNLSIHNMCGIYISIYSWIAYYTNLIIVNSATWMCHVHTMHTICACMPSAYVCERDRTCDFTCNSASLSTTANVCVCLCVCINRWVHRTVWTQHNNNKKKIIIIIIKRRTKHMRWMHACKLSLLCVPHTCIIHCILHCVLYFIDFLFFFLFIHFIFGAVVVDWLNMRIKTQQNQQQQRGTHSTLHKCVFVTTPQP